jgi:hypothetical protein
LDSPDTGESYKSSIVLRALTFQIQVTTPLTRHLPIALDLAALTFITEDSIVSSAVPTKAPKEKTESYDVACKTAFQTSGKTGR